MSDAATSTPHGTGRLHDGLTARGQAVVLSLGADALEIAPEDGSPTVRWPYAGLVAIEPLRPGRPAVLARGPDDDARLTFTPSADYGALLARAPQLAEDGTAALTRGAGRAVLWGAVTAAMVATLWFAWPRIADGLAAFVPARVEARLGEQAREQFLASTKPCDQAEGRAALDRLLARLLAVMKIDGSITVTVIDLPIVNALALPGGQILLFNQLILDAQSPEEVAGVLAHEIGHLIGRHPTRNLVRQFGLNLIIMALSGSSSWDGAAQLLLSNAYTRELEGEADTRALDALAAAGIGSQGWIDFFSRHGGPEGTWDKATAYLDNHPPSTERRDRAKSLPPSTSPAMSAGEWLVLRSICGRPALPRPRR